MNNKDMIKALNRVKVVYKDAQLHMLLGDRVDKFEYNQTLEGIETLIKLFEPLPDSYEHKPSPVDTVSDYRPENCRDRLRDEKKPYPRSNCIVPGCSYGHKACEGAHKSEPIEGDYKDYVMLRCIEGHTGQQFAACDTSGNMFPGQRSVDLKMKAGDLPTLSVAFLVHPDLLYTGGE